MELVHLSKTIFSGSLLDRPGLDEDASAALFVAFLKEAWRTRAGRDWPGATVCVHLTCRVGQGLDSPLEMWGENAAGDIEDLDWLIPEYEADALRLCESFHAWAVPAERG